MATRAALPLRESETQFQAALLEYAHYRRWRTFHTYDARRSAEGFPDLVLVRPPRLIFAELKSDTGDVSPEQRKWIEALGACAGAQAFIWRPIDWVQIVEVLA